MGIELYVLEGDLTMLGSDRLGKIGFRVWGTNDNKTPSPDVHSCSVASFGQLNQGEVKLFICPCTVPHRVRWQRQPVC